MDVKEKAEIFRKVRSELGMGVGFYSIKRTLEEVDFDYDKAVTLIRERVENGEYQTYPFILR